MLSLLERVVNNYYKWLHVIFPHPPQLFSFYLLRLLGLQAFQPRPLFTILDFQCHRGLATGMPLPVARRTLSLLVGDPLVPHDDGGWSVIRPGSTQSSSGYLVDGCLILLDLRGGAVPGRGAGAVVWAGAPPRVVREAGRLGTAPVWGPTVPLIGAVPGCCSLSVASPPWEPLRGPTCVLIAALALVAASLDSLTSWRATPRPWPRPWP